jgi:probable HAF family extracellular repeat protein
MAGWATRADGSGVHAFFYDGTMRDLGTLNGSQSLVFGINDSGSVVGVSQTSDPAIWHAFLYSDGTMTDLGTLPGGIGSQAEAVNSSGQVCGESQLYIGGIGHTHAVLFYSGGTPIDLGTLPGFPESWANAINDSGQVLGYSYDPWSVCPGTDDAVGSPFMYSDGQMVDITQLTGFVACPAAGLSFLNAAVNTIGLGLSPVRSDFPMTMLSSNRARRRVFQRASAINYLGAIAATGLSNGTPSGFLLTPCNTARCPIQATIDAQCPCAEAHSHGSYVSCASGVLGQLVSVGSLPGTCKRNVKSCAAKSTCGKPGFVTCMVGTRCTIKSSATKCLAAHGVVGTGSTCCAACPPSATTEVPADSLS